MSWTARCREQTFYCSGEDAPTCAPELESAEAEPAPAPNGAEPPAKSELPADPPPPEPPPPTDAKESDEQEATTDDPA